jgi:hypothetical protein
MSEGGVVQVLGFLIFLFVSHFGLMQIFRLTTYHAFFWKALPLLLAYSAGVGWALYSLNMHPFFLWQLVLASIWLFVVGRKQSKAAEALLAVSGEDADYVRLMANSTAKTIRYFTYSSIIYIVVFAVTYVWLYNI